MKRKPSLSIVLSLAIGFTPVSWAQTTAPAAPQAAAASQTFSQGELESMLAPIALYPDALLSQIMMASTYPLEIVEAARWRKSNASLTENALQDALQKQSWDESVKSLTAFPDVLDRMNQDLAWTQKLGDAFLAQQDQVMDTIQSLRAKAQAAGHLQSNEQQKVEVQQADNKQYIVIEPANPQIVYVPTYQPTVVYGAWGYPAYPPYWAPVATPFVSGFFWGVGIAAGAALWGGVNWGHNDVNINVNRYNNYNRTNINNSNWNHNVNHRGAVPYRDNGSRDKYKASDRQAAAAREQFRGRDDSLGGAGLNDRAGLKQAQQNPAVRDAGARDRAGAGAGTGVGAGAGAGTRDLSAANRGGATAGTRDLGAGGQGGAAAAQRPSTAQTDRGGAFSGGNGAQTRAASDRGRSSMSGATAQRPSGGGGAARGGGGGARGGGGGRR